MPTKSHLVSVKVYDTSNNPVEGAVVSLTHSTGSLSSTTNSKGEAIINLSNLTSWNSGDSITISTTVLGKGTATKTTKISGRGGQKEELSLSETSDLDWERQDELIDRFPLNFSILTSFDGEKITTTNPLPVFSVESVKQNVSYTMSYDANNNLTQVDMTIGNEKYRRTLNYDANNNLISVSKWTKI
jgi:hypothetical protein